MSYDDDNYDSSYLDRMMAETDQRYSSRYEAESKRNLEKIQAFATAHGLEQKTYEMRDKKVLVLQAKGASQIDQEKIATYIGLHLRAEAHPEGIAYQCIPIARRSVESGYVKGKIFAIGVDHEFCDFDTHCINYDVLKDGTYVAVDLTASEDIDRGQNNFAVLVVRAQSLEELLQRVGELYGGNWDVKLD